MRGTWAAALIWITATSVANGPIHAADSPVGRALAELTQRLEQRPRDAGLLNDYGNLLLHAGFIDEAERAYRAALEAAPDSLPANYNLGLLELELGHARAARKRFRQAIKIDSSFGRARYGLGSTYAALDRNRRAVEHYSKAFLLDPALLDVGSNPEILFNRLTSWASMHGYLAASTGRASRLYDDPRPIVGLLIPGIDELVDRADVPEEEAPTDPPEEGEAAAEAEAAEEVG